jgi:hypothetical protein
MVLNIFKQSKYVIKHITENHIELVNRGFDFDVRLNNYEVNYNHVEKYNSSKMFLENYSLCGDAFKTKSPNKCQQ